MQSVNVITEELIYKAIQNGLDADQRSSISFYNDSDVTTLSLNYHNLSFNRIRKIEGLDTLFNLQELSLFNNKIEKLENLENLVNLEFLSVGNNCLTVLDEIVSLQTLPNLKSLNMAENPICDCGGYRRTVVNHLRRLKFLDYSVVNENERNVPLSIIDGERNENTERNKKVKPVGILKKIKNNESNELCKIPFQLKISFNIYEKSRLEYEKQAEKNAEIKEFEAYLIEVKQKNLQTVISEIDDFTACKTKTWKELKVSSDRDSVETLITLYDDKIAELWERLMYLEDLIKVFEQNIKDILNGWMDKIRQQLVECRKAIHRYNMLMSKEVVAFCEHLMTSQWQEEILSNEKLRTILLRKESLHETFKNSLEVSLQVIDNFEDHANEKIKIFLEYHMQKLHHKEEIERNRQRVIEINHFVDFLRDEIDNYSLNILNNQ
ncbi:hypothetical protein HELRODRAFT_158382 [Helobdella robusta]|uniref:Dynein regulatory complex subunit 3 n=1 Tax=Helobdella robusta TaxID=6412 RepID=T1EMQ7_HELRO|nr:hypothetical protein HELRODRAFT_158382 [Helobdella robusta]ESO11996.1 hypothetical protein HELRODRAFT_158382 [Helobdella robusta]